MLQGIFDVLTSIGDFFAGIIDFITGFFEDLVGFVQELAGVGSQISSFLGAFPVAFLASIAGLIVIMVLLRVLGRD